MIYIRRIVLIKHSVCLSVAKLQSSPFLIKKINTAPLQQITKALQQKLYSICQLLHIEPIMILWFTSSVLNVAHEILNAQKKH